jgi:hypothetical protein
MALREALLKYRAQKLKIAQIKADLKEENARLDELEEQAITEMELVGTDSMRITDDDGIESTMYLRTSAHPSIIDPDALAAWLKENQPDITMQDFMMISAQKLKGFCKDYDISEMPPGIDFYTQPKMGMRKA